jgi:fumarate reductase subunit D
VSEVLVVLLSLLLNALLPYGIVKRDLARLSEDRLCRAWTDASFLSAVLAFGPLSLPVHFTKTRRSLPGFAHGVLLCTLSLFVQGLAAFGLSALLGVPTD